MDKITISRNAALKAEKILTRLDPPTNEMLRLFLNQHLASEGLEVEIATGFDSDDELSDKAVLDAANKVMKDRWSGMI